ncbi:MAG: tRNA lysidine(34) synthetase TilS [Candidatus Krumholzibacteriia bacterium]
MSEHPFIRRLLPHLDALVRRAAPATNPAATGLLVALSGGPDSVALLLLAHARSVATGAPLAAAHLNHRLRGDQAEADEAFCRDLCARLAVPLHVARSDPRALARRRGLGLEEAGRRLRRRLLTRLLAARPDLACAATGHHRDDQTETVIMRLFRGAGLEGMRGIRPVAGQFIHPLLVTDRRAILAFLADSRQPWREDATNAAGDAVRSRLRRELLPLARDIFGAGADRGPARLAGLLDDDAGLLDRQARAALAAATAPGDEPALAAAALRALDAPLARRVVRLHLAERHGRQRDLGLAHADGLLAWLADAVSGHGIDLPGGWRAELDFDRLRFHPPAPAHLPENGTFHIMMLAGGEAPPSPDPGQELWSLELPSDALRGVPRARRWRPGDRLRLPGLGGRKKVSDLLRERRVPAGRRGDVRVVEDDESLLWVVGLAHADRCVRLPGTRPTVTLVVRAPRPRGNRH